MTWKRPEINVSGAISLRNGAPAEISGPAIASMVLGLLWIGGLGSILALVFGYVSKRAIQQSHGGQIGRGLATAGIVLGWVGLLGTIVCIGLLVSMHHGVPAAT
jgi:uncharacterized membrane protein